MFADSVRDLDLLLVPLQRTFTFQDLPDLMTDDQEMKRFLLCTSDTTAAATWAQSSGINFRTVYEGIERALNNVNLQGAASRRQTLVTNGVMQVFADNFSTHALPPSVQTTDLRDINSAAYLKRMRQYTESCVTGVTDALQLEAQNVEAGTWELQIRSKIRFLTSMRGGMPPRPFLCLELLLAIHREFTRTPDALKEVSSSTLT